MKNETTPTKVPWLIANNGLAAGVIVAALVYSCFWFPFVGTMLNLLESRLYDFKMNITAVRSFNDFAKNIVVLKIDDESFAKLDMKWPWNRRIYAKAVRSLSEAGARVIAFDVFFSETSRLTDDVAQDSVFANAVNESTVPVVLSYSPSDPLIKALADTKASLGFIENLFDDDSIVRRSRFFAKKDTNQSVELNASPASPDGNSWNFMVLKEFLGLQTGSVDIADSRLKASYTAISRSGGVTVMKDRKADFQLLDGRDILINYAVGSNYFFTLPFYKVITHEYDPDWFRGKIVLIGATVRSLHDDFATPLMLKTGNTMPGVFIHAFAQATFLENAFIFRAGLLANFLLTLAACVFLGMMIHEKTPITAFLISLGLAMAYFLFSTVMFFMQIFIHTATPQLSLIATYVIMTSYKYLREEREKQFIKTIFKQYVTSEVVEELLHDPSKLALGGQNRCVTILFTDIRNFTRLSEQISPEAAVELLNSYFDEMVQIIYRYEGTLDKYLGDGMMVIFGAPIEQPDSAMRAVKCALEMQRVSIEFSRLRREKSLPAIDGIGIGINTGAVVVGNIGSQKHKEYTIIGDNVNLASRIVSIALVNQVLVSENTFRIISDRVEVKKKETVKLKGKTEPVDIYEIVRTTD